MQLSWPPRPLGLQTSFNLAWASPETAPLVRRSWWLVLLFGTVVPFGMVVIDDILFAGASRERIRELGSQPFVFRVVVIVYSGVTEEIIYRLFVTTLVAWGAFATLRTFLSDSKVIAQWIGVVGGAIVFGFAHIGNAPDVAHPVARAVVLNGMAGVIFGGLYWWRGLEVAILTHMLAIAVLYVGIAPFI